MARLVIFSLLVLLVSGMSESLMHPDEFRNLRKNLNFNTLRDYFEIDPTVLQKTLDLNKDLKQAVKNEEIKSKVVVDGMINNLQEIQETFYKIHEAYRRRWYNRLSSDQITPTTLNDYSLDLENVRKFIDTIYENALDFVDNEKLGTINYMETSLKIKCKLNTVLEKLYKKLYEVILYAEDQIFIMEVFYTVSMRAPANTQQETKIQASDRLYHRVSILYNEVLEPISDALDAIIQYKCF